MLHLVDGFVDPIDFFGSLLHGFDRTFYPLRVFKLLDVHFAPFLGLNLLPLNISFHLFLSFQGHFSLDFLSDDFLLQVSDILFEVIKMLLVKLFLQVVLNFVNSMLLVQLGLQVLKLSVNSSLFLGFLGLLLLGEGLFVSLVQSF